MSDPSKMKFTSSHEWVSRNGNRIRVGITDYFQDQLSDIVNIELPEPDDHHYEAGDEICVIESLKTAADLHAPVAGTIVAINTDLHGSPELINKDPFNAGWLVEMKPDRIQDIARLMAFDEYEVALPEEEEE